MQLRAAIFDFDGTIADTFQEVVAILNSLSGEFGYRVAAPSELEELRGMPPRAVAMRLGVGWHKLPAIASRARAELGKNMGRVRPFDGVPEALAELRARGLLVGLLTSNSRQNVDLFLSAHPIVFDFVSTGSGLWSKHHRLARLLKRHGLRPEHAAYVGDEVRDIEAARALGVRAVAVAWGYAKPELLASMQPDVIASHAADLVATLAAPV